MDKKRTISLKRAETLKNTIVDYLEIKDKIPFGIKKSLEIAERQEKIKAYFGINDEQWNDWHWQMRNRISDAKLLAQFIDLDEKEIILIDKVAAKYRWAISPYYVSLMAEKDKNCPIRLQSIPDIRELEDHYGKDDPMGEEYTSPVEHVTRRYADRLIIKVTNQCPMYCRHCQRRRGIGETDVNVSKKELQAALDYVRNNEEIRDVLITGGDALMLSDETLDWLLTELDNIPHVEIKRLGTRTLVTLPSRITDDLCGVLEKHMPLYINTQFNHPAEITEEVRIAAKKLVKAGVSLGNQAVLLNAINNDKYVMKKMNQALLQVMIRPYYIFQAKEVSGTTHFIAKIEEGLEIMEYLRGYTSGLAVPTYIVNAPKGQGKTPLMPQYIIYHGKDKVKIRTWENKVIEYKN